jgi:argininosuccinate lyase
VSENSVDAVEDRDFVVEFLAWAALVQVHLSGLAENLILWASQELGFVEIDQAYATGSSLMPQKKNPDSLELMRGKSGRMVGHLVGLLTTLKGLPSAYNKDLQEDKEALFDAVDTLKLELPIASGVVRTLKVHSARMAGALDDGLLATDLADYLVRKGVPFRESHHLVGQAVRRAEALGVSLKDLDLAEYQAIHPAFSEDTYAVLDFRRSVEVRDVEGGTAPGAVRAQIGRARELLAQN